MRREDAVTWESVYEYWKLYKDNVPESSVTPLSVERIPVPYNRQDEYFYGYDWLSQEDCAERKRLIKDDIASFMWFTHPTNKGTIHTLKMLMAAKDEEERAAIWICAFTMEIMNHSRGTTYRMARAICGACWSYLSQRFFMWHHAMKSLVPEVFIGHELLEAEYSSIYAIVDLARINMAFVTNAYVPVLYSSLKPEEAEPKNSVRIAE